MSNRIINAAVSVLGKLLRGIPHPYTLGERVFFSRQARGMRLYINRAESILVQRQLELIEELTKAIKRKERDQTKIDSLLAEFFEVSEERERLRVVEHKSFGPRL
jgi:hypothetical protein